MTHRIKQIRVKLSQEKRLAEERENEGCLGQDEGHGADERCTSSSAEGQINRQLEGANR